MRFALLLVVGSAVPDGAPPTVRVEQGALVGAKLESGVEAFLGIPYAKPPVGPLRFRAPEAPASWEGDRPADRFGPSCPQPRTWDGLAPIAADQSEDCLSLNVWTLGAASAPRPVLVWLHGGGFVAGSGREARSDGRWLARKGAVVVTLNSRLGPLGYLVHPALAAESSRGASGNYGLLDQIAALQWIHRNIARFGGDPTRVTLLGERAGAASAALLAVSPLAAGLFHRVILQSPVDPATAAAPRAGAADDGVRLASSIGAAGGDGLVAARLRSIPADSLLAAVAAASGRLQCGEPAPPIRLGPTIEGWVVPGALDSSLARAGSARIQAIIGSDLRVAGDSAGTVPAALARLLAARGGNVYLYRFQAPTVPADGDEPGGEVPFVFGHAIGSAADSALADRMGDYWLAFAATGDPNAGARGRRPVWPKYDPGTKARLDLVDGR